jgi:hypothetical protein
MTVSHARNGRRQTLEIVVNGSPPSRFAGRGIRGHDTTEALTNGLFGPEIG